MPWHRMFGLTLMDFFRGLPVTVELEKDLSLKRQLLDVVIVRADVTPLPVELPHGMEDLGPHNLITFKSLQEPLDAWALKELVGHYVNYRKQTGPSVDEMPPEEDFRLYAVSARFPSGLARAVRLEEVREGVYDVRYFDGAIRVVVVNQLPEDVPNAMLHLFGTSQERIGYGVEHYHPRSKDMSTVLDRLFTRHLQEGTIMADALEEFGRLHGKEYLAKIPAKLRLEGLTPEQVREIVPPTEYFKGLSPTQIGDALPLGVLEEAIRQARKRQEEGDG